MGFLPIRPLAAFVALMFCGCFREESRIGGGPAGVASKERSQKDAQSSEIPMPLSTNAVAEIDARILYTIGSVHKQVRLADVEVVRGNVDTNKEIYVYFTQTLFTMTNGPMTRWRFFLAEKAKESKQAQYWWLVADRYDHDGMVLIK